MTVVTVIGPMITSYLAEPPSELKVCSGGGACPGPRYFRFRTALKARVGMESVHMREYGQCIREPVVRTLLRVRRQWLLSKYKRPRPPTSASLHMWARVSGPPACYMEGVCLDRRESDDTLHVAGTCEPICSWITSG